MIKIGRMKERLKEGRLGRDSWTIANFPLHFQRNYYKHFLAKLTFFKRFFTILNLGREWGIVFGLKGKLVKGGISLYCILHILLEIIDHLKESHHKIF